MSLSLFPFTGPILALVTVAFFPALYMLRRDWHKRRVVLWGALSLVGSVVWIGWFRSGIIWPVLDRIPGVTFHETNLPFPGMDVTPSRPGIHDDSEASHRARIHWPMGCDEQVVTRVTRTHVYFDEGDDKSDMLLGCFGSGRQAFDWSTVSDYTWEFSVFPDV